LPIPWNERGWSNFLHPNGSNGWNGGCGSGVVSCRAAPATMSGRKTSRVLKGRGVVEAEALADHRVAVRMRPSVLMTVSASLAAAAIPTTAELPASFSSLFAKPRQVSLDREVVWLVTGSQGLGPDGPIEVSLCCVTVCEGVEVTGAVEGNLQRPF
jgi:hypothetical protein